MALAKDPSTLAALHPAQPRELHYKGHRSSLRLHGSHFMQLRRPSRQPESGREYVAGDPVNLIDWKAYARTDQLIIREVRDEAAARILIGVDVTETMLWPGPELAQAQKVPVTKAELALRVGLNLAHMHLRMGDLVELWILSDGKARRPHGQLKPRSPADVVAVFDRLVEGAGPETALGAACAEEFAPQILEERPRDAVFWVGDGLGAADFGAVLALGRRSFHLHVLSSLELDIGWVEGDTSYFDEGFERKEYQGQVLRHRDNYAKHLAGWRQKLERRQRKRGGDFLTVSDRTQVSLYQTALAAFVKALT